MCVVVCFVTCRLALYVPSAVDLTRGGFFYKRPDGTYDTIISAQHILKSMSDSHDKQLAGMKLQLQESRDLLGSFAGAAKGRKETLLDLVNTGLSTDDNVSTWSCCCINIPTSGPVRTCCVTAPRCKHPQRCI
eukprot:GHUV01051172.1.p1 GENE.GHUV01051172.1~~GHUV01051172.1.p1  ORF type:complete len:133 (-),score=27.66 GHUV01051172.1:305-703(-)